MGGDRRQVDDRAQHGSRFDLGPLAMLDHPLGRHLRNPQARKARCAATVLPPHPLRGSGFPRPHPCGWRSPGCPPGRRHRWSLTKGWRWSASRSDRPRNMRIGPSARASSPSSASSRASSGSANITFAPLSTRCRAMARPMPLAAPVTMAVLPETEKDMGSLLVDQGLARLGLMAWITRKPLSRATSLTSRKHSDSTAS